MKRLYDSTQRSHKDTNNSSVKRPRCVYSTRSIIKVRRVRKVKNTLDDDEKGVADKLSADDKE